LFGVKQTAGSAPLPLLTACIRYPERVKWTVLSFLLVAGAGQAEWLSYRSGPFEVIAEDRTAARAALNRMEQTRYLLGELLGKPDMKLAWPVRVVLPKKPLPAKPVKFGRAGWITTAALPEEAARLLLEANAGRMPKGIDEGVLAFLSTLEATGPRLTVGAPPQASEHNRDWARIHMLAIDDRYRGKLRVLLSNLAKGIDPEPAYRNAFERQVSEIEKEVDGYLAAAKFESIQMGGRPVDPESQFNGKPVEFGPFLAEVSSDPAAAFKALLNKEQNVLEAHEGLGLLALESGDHDAARQHLEAAVKLGSKNPRVFGALNDWRKAAELNPNWAEPAFRMAQGEADAGRKVHLLKAAAALDIRNAGYWMALAEAYQSANQFSDAARAWAAAERASRDEKALAAIRSAREDIERKRADFEAAERRRAAEEKQRETERLKAEAMSRIRAAEARARQGVEPLPAETKVVPWFETDLASGKATGTLDRVECSGGTARLIILTPDKKVRRLLVKNPSQLVVIGGGERTLACGLQKPARQIKVEFVPRKDAKAMTEGDAQVIEFH
jgi:tetratricopeptide (TPR) repeat protein